MSRPLRFAVHGLAGLSLAGALALGWAWHRDRARAWEAPRWSEGTFVPLRAGQRVDSDGQATWMVAVNPRCPRCLATLRRLDGEWRRHRRPERLVALIVDTPASPGAGVLGALPPVPAWWDRHGVWRRRWGHRLYGELIEFDPAGCYVRTHAAAELVRNMRDTPPGRSRAPVTTEQGGT